MPGGHRPPRGEPEVEGAPTAVHEDPRALPRPSVAVHRVTRVTCSWGRGMLSEGAIVTNLGGTIVTLLVFLGCDIVKQMCLEGYISSWV